MSKKYDARKFNDYDFYDVNEVAEILSVNPKTVRKWELEGLKMDRQKRPIYIHGKDIKAFLKQKKLKRRCKLGIKEFYCSKCRAAVDIEPNSFEYTFTEKCLGAKNNRQVITKGKCKNCGTKVARFWSEQKINILEKLFKT